MVILLSFVSSFLFTSIIVLTKRFHIAFSTDTTSGLQKMHTGDVPRVGGLALILSIFTVTMISGMPLYQELFLASLPVVFAGLAEDLSKSVSSKMRLAAALLSGVLFMYLSGASFTKIDIYQFDRLITVLNLWPVMTVLAIAALANSMNIIDGYHGLASAAFMIMSAGLASLAFHSGDFQLGLLILSLIATIGGFFVVNFPFGKIFLGDAGAYFCGFALACVSALLLSRNPDIPPLVLLVIFAYPITELLFSIIRKFSRDGHYIDQPDRVHFHMLAFRRIKSWSSLSLLNPNARTGLMLQVLPLTGFLWITVLPVNRFFCLSYFLIFVLSYLRCYKKLSLNG